jgi:hypothetical protein
MMLLIIEYVMFTYLSHHFLVFGNILVFISKFEIYLVNSIFVKYYLSHIDIDIDTKTSFNFFTKFLFHLQLDIKNFLHIQCISYFRLQEDCKLQIKRNLFNFFSIAKRKNTPIKTKLNN